MGNNRKNIDDLFKDELGSYTETPPPAVWDALEKKLDRSTPKPRSPYIWFGYLAIMCVLVTISVLVARSIPGSKDIHTTALNNDATTSSANSTSREPVNNNGQTAPNNTPGNNQQPVGDQQHTNENTINPPANKNTEATNTNGTKSSDIKNNDNATANTHKKNEPKSAVTNHNKKTKKGSAKTKNTNNYGRSYTENGTKTKTGKQNESTSVVVNNLAQQPKNEYNSSGPNNNENDEAPANKNEEAKQNPPAKHDSVFAKPPVDHVAEKEKKQPKPKFTRFEAGLKGGYELGFDNDAAKKGVFSPYVQYKITRRLAIMLQPAIKYASLSSRQIGNEQSYYSINNDGILYKDHTPTGVPVGDTALPMWLWKYTYVQTHDSIVKTNKTGGTYMELELPVLLKFYIAPRISVYGGINITYSQLTGIREQTTVIRSLPNAATAISIGPVDGPAPATPENIYTDITYTGTPISSYTGPKYPAAQGSLLRYGYMFGLNYEFDRKWMIDVLVQQATVTPNVQGGYNTNSPLSAPYIRFTLGYKLTK